MLELNETEVPWINWRSLSGYVYLLICITDFLIMPALLFADNRNTKEIIVNIIKEESDKKFVLDIINSVSNARWEPVTVIGGGLFHISFGAILTGVAITRGQERREMVKYGK